MVATGCGRDAPEDSGEAYREETSNPSVEAGLPEDTEADETPNPSVSTSDVDTETDESADTVSSGEEQTAPKTVAAYLSAAENLWRSDNRIAYLNGDLNQCQEVNLEKDYGCEIITPEGWTETGNFTFSLYIDGNPDNQNPDNLYVLEGNKDYIQIVFNGAYKLGNTLYLGTSRSYDGPLFALDLETKTLSDCGDEYEAVQKIYSDWLQGQPEDINLRIQYFQPIAHVDGCLVYTATISEQMDTDTRAVIYAAFDESRSLRAYLLLTDDDIVEGNEDTP